MQKKLDLDGKPLGVLDSMNQSQSETQSTDMTWLPVPLNITKSRHIICKSKLTLYSTNEWLHEGYMQRQPSTLLHHRSTSAVLQVSPTFALGNESTAQQSSINCPKYTNTLLFFSFVHSLILPMSCCMSPVHLPPLTLPSIVSHHSLPCTLSLNPSADWPLLFVHLGMFLPKREL